ASKLPDRVRAVDSVLEGTGAAPSLALRPDQAWLADPARQYPVTIDPAVTLADNLDTDVNNANPTTNYHTLDILRVGNYLGAAVNRSFLRFDDSAIKNKHVTSATLNLWQGGSATCTPQPTVVQGASGMGPGTTWNTQPAADGVNWGNASFNNGGACGAGGTNNDITRPVGAWGHNGHPPPGGPPGPGPPGAGANHIHKFSSAPTVPPRRHLPLLPRHGRRPVHQPVLGAVRRQPGDGADQHHHPDPVRLRPRPRRRSGAAGLRGVELDRHRAGHRRVGAERAIELARVLD